MGYAGKNKKVPACLASRGQVVDGKSQTAPVFLSRGVSQRGEFSPAKKKDITRISDLRHYLLEVEKIILIIQNAT
jgi:hypothetical protein